MVTLEPKFQLVGPYAPTDFEAVATILATIETDVGTLTGVSTSSLASAVPFTVRGNIFILVSYT